MKTISLELEGIEILVAFEPEYREVIEADTPMGAIVRDKLYDIEIFDIRAVKFGDDWEGRPYNMSMDDLYNHISHANLLEAIDNNLMYI